MHVIILSTMDISTARIFTLPEAKTRQTTSVHQRLLVNRTWGESGSLGGTRVIRIDYWTGVP